MLAAARNSRAARSPLQAQAGLTLVEVLLATVLLVLMTAIVYGVIVGIVRTRNAVDLRRQSMRTVRAAFTRMSQDLVNRAFEPISSDDNSGQPETSSGLPSTGHTFMRSKNAREGDFDRDVLRFATNATSQTTLGGTTNFGTIEVEYRLEPAPAGTGQTPGRLPKFVLVRDEVPAGLKDQDLREQKRITSPVAEGVISINFRFFNRGKWKDTWDTGASQIPDAIEITLGLVDEGDKVREYRTAIALNIEVKRRLSTNNTPGS